MTKLKLFDVGLISALTMVVIIAAIVVTCGTDNPTEPTAANGEPDEEDRDEIIYVTSDPAYVTEDGVYVYTKNFLGNPTDTTLAVPLYVAIVLYNDRTEILRIGFGACYEVIGNDGIGYTKKNVVEPHKYVQPSARVKFDDISYRPLYYSNVYAWTSDQAEVEEIIEKHFARLAMGKTPLNKGCLLK